MRRTAVPWTRGAALAAALWLAPGAAGLGAQEVPVGPADPPPVVHFRLEEPRPSPFQDSVAIPFVLGEGPEPRWRTSVVTPPPAGVGGGEDPVGTEERSRDARPDSATVSIRVYNLLHQRVAWARAASPELRAGEAVREMRLGVPGRYTAVWDGRAEDGYGVVSGPYFVEIVVDGWTAVRKVLLTR